jgi:hypothetical protein
MRRKRAAVRLRRRVPLQRASGAPAARWRRPAVFVSVAVTVISVTGYVASSFTIDGLPSYQPSAGWVAVLQPAAAPDADTVQLLVQARTQGGQSQAAYDVVVCGPRPYAGDLLIGGSAQLTGIRPDPDLPAPLARLVRVQRLPDLVFNYDGMINLGSVQLIQISLPDVPACPPAAAQSAGILFDGTAEEVAGVTARPVQQSWQGWWGWWHGPHASQAWPLTGVFPGVPANVSGEFTAVTGLTGNWTRPVRFYAQVTAVGVPVNWSVDSAVPAPSGPYPLTWQSSSPISPTAMLSDSSSLALLQNWVVIFAMVFGIAGGLLAGILLEWLRSPRADDRTPDGNPQHDPGTAMAAIPAQRQPAVPVRGRWLALAGTVIIVGYARSRLFRRGRGTRQ